MVLLRGIYAHIQVTMDSMGSGLRGMEVRDGEGGIGSPSPDMIVHTCNVNTEDCLEFEASLAYIVSLRQALGIAQVRTFL